MKPWLKITFDPTMPGTALVLVGMFHSTLHRIPGRWIVFDKSYGYGPDDLPLHPLFDAETSEECHAFIRKNTAPTLCAV